MHTHRVARAREWAFVYPCAFLFSRPSSSPSFRYILWCERAWVCTTSIQKQWKATYSLYVYAEFPACIWLFDSDSGWFSNVYIIYPYSIHIKNALFAAHIKFWFPIKSRSLPIIYTLYKATATWLVDVWFTHSHTCMWNSYIEIV